MQQLSQEAQKNDAAVAVTTSSSAVTDADRRAELAAVSEELDLLLCGPVTRSDCAAAIKRADMSIAICTKESEEGELKCLLQLNRAKLLKRVVSLHNVTYIYMYILEPL